MVGYKLIIIIMNEILCGCGCMLTKDNPCQGDCNCIAAVEKRAINKLNKTNMEKLKFNAVYGENYPEEEFKQLEKQMHDGNIPAMMRIIMHNQLVISDAIKALDQTDQSEELLPAEEDAIEYRHYVVVYENKAVGNLQAVVRVKATLDKDLIEVLNDAQGVIEGVLGHLNFDIISIQEDIN